MGQRGLTCSYLESPTEFSSSPPVDHALDTYGEARITVYPGVAAAKSRTSGSLVSTRILTTSNVGKLTTRGYMQQ